MMKEIKAGKEKKTAKGKSEERKMRENPSGTGGGTGFLREEDRIMRVSYY